MNARRFARFGPFRVDLVTGELTKHDRRLRLQNQAFQILALLLERSGDLVTREEIRSRVWSGGTVVEFEHSIATAVKKLRQTLGDDPDRPSYVETLPRRGYRWRGPVTWDGPETTARSGPAPPLPPRPALVGREEPLATLRDSLGRASAGERQIVWISGEPGIGKTALVDEFVSQLAAERPLWRVARGQCIEWQGGAEPYYPILEALGELLRTDERDALIAELALRAPTWLAQFPAQLTPDRRAILDREILGMTRKRMLREICEALDAITSSQPLLMLFEDLHWADPSTLDLISAVARRRSLARLFMVATCRSVEADHPLQRLKDDLLARRLGREIALEPLTESDVARFLSGGPAGASPDETLARLVYRYSAGNPLFIMAVLDDMTRRGLIRREGDAVLPGDDLRASDIGVPITLAKMIETQIDRLSGDERETLEVASVVGEVFSTSLVAAAMKADPESIDRKCESIARRHRLLTAMQTPGDSVWHATPDYRFNHALYRDVLYGTQSSRRRTRWHLRVGEEMERVVGPVSMIPDAVDVHVTRPVRGPGAARLVEAAPEMARHFEAGGDWCRAAKYLGMMAGTSSRRSDPGDVIALWQRALDLVTRLPEQDESRAGVEVVILQNLAITYVVSYDARAVATFETLVSRSARHGMVAAEISGLVGMTYPSSWVDSRPSLAALERALALSEGIRDPLLKARVRASCLVRRIWAGGWSATDDAACRAALAEIRSLGEPRVVAAHLLDFNFVRWVSSEYRVARRDAMESLAILLGDSDENPYLNFWHWLSQFVSTWSLLLLGEWGEMLREIESGVTLATRNGDEYRAQTLRLYQAWLHLFAMDYPAVVAIWESIQPMVAGPERSPWRRFGLALAGTAEAAMGHTQPALDRLSSASAEMEHQPVIFDWYTRMMIGSALTDLWLEQGDNEQARRHAAQFLDSTLATAERTWQALAWEVSARVARASGDLSRARDCVTKALAAMEGFDVPLAAWRVHATAAGILESLRDPVSAERHRTLSRSTIQKVANSLPPTSPLRRTFLSAPPVARVVADRPA
jgi:DNA-binding winged helix-turn-helix (wHTH) protein